MIQLRVGGRYRSRNGESVTIESECHEKPAYFAFKGINGRYYARHGAWTVEPHPRDLIEEIQETSMLKLEVGKKYKTRGGETAEVVYIDTANVAKPVVVRINGELDTHTARGMYHENGRTLSNGDLISEVKPTRRITGWVNVYKDRVHTAEIWSSRAQADSMASNSRTHVIFIDVDAEEVSHD